MNTETSGSSTSGHFKLAWRWIFSTTRIHASRLREAITNLLSIRSVLYIVLAVLLLHLFGFISLPFPPFTTTGTIYVNSPEVYTRERLVNDRYDQDYWLRERLKMLNEPDKLRLVVGQQLKSTTVGTGKSAQQEGKSTVSNEGHQVTDKPQRLSFEQEFRVASRIRDMLRQQILENMLDDRHDLTGNSVFGLKFDTTVIPGNNTHRRAFVQVALNIDPTFLEPPDGEKDGKAGNGRSDAPQKGFGAHIDGWMAARFLPFLDEKYHEKNGAELKKIEKFKKQEEHYLDWLADVKRRLNIAEDSVYQSLVRSEQELQWKVGYSTECWTDAGLSGPIKLPDPWDKFFGIYREPFLFSGNFDDSSQKHPQKYPRVWFDVIELRETFVIDKGPPDPSKEQVAREPVVGNPDSGDQTPEPVQQNEEGGVVAEPPENSGPHRPGESACDPRRVRSFYNSLTGKTLKIVLGIPEEMFWRLNDPSLMNYGSSEPATRLSDAQTGTKEESATVAESSIGTDTALPSAACEESGTREKDEHLKPIGSLHDDEWIIFVSPEDYEEREANFGDASSPKYTLTENFVKWLIDKEKELCPYLQKKDEYCDDPQRTKVEIMSGLFNFVERMNRRNAYPYAIFPKNDVVGIFAETSEQLSAASPATGFLDLAKRLTTTSTAAVLTGYEDGRGGKLSIDFGWIISTPGEMDPTQKSQLALVSVPAWTKQLNLTISVGWLDRHGNIKVDEDASFDLKIAVPPNYEVFDAIFREDVQVTLKPSIRDNEMDTDIYLRAGKKAKILIPGSRLWRSTTVTLGAQMAKRITVLPNMEGIIAEFDPVASPYVVSNLKSDSKECKKPIPYKTGSNLHAIPVRLRVWTSEGVTLAKKKVCVVFNPEEILPEEIPSTGSGSTEATD